MIFSPQRFILNQTHVLFANLQMLFYTFIVSFLCLQNCKWVRERLSSSLHSSFSMRSLCGICLLLNGCSILSIIFMLLGSFVLLLSYGFGEACPSIFTVFILYFPLSYVKLTGWKGTFCWSVGQLASSVYKAKC